MNRISLITHTKTLMVLHLVAYNTRCSCQKVTFPFSESLTSFPGHSLCDVQILVWLLVSESRILPKKGLMFVDFILNPSLSVTLTLTLHL